MKRQTVVLPNGFNGHTRVFFADPVEEMGDTVKVSCATPGDEYMFRWIDKGELADRVRTQELARRHAVGLPILIEIVELGDFDNPYTTVQHVQAWEHIVVVELLEDQWGFVWDGETYTQSDKARKWCIEWYGFVRAHVLVLRADLEYARARNRREMQEHLAF
jgi:hypothetical protein